MKFTLACMAGLAIVVWVFGLFFRVNFTPSVPVGLYVLQSGAPHRGDLVSLCAPEAIIDEGLAKGYIPQPGTCRHLSMPLLKHLAAVGGDVVNVAESGITINGRMWPGSARRHRTLSGKPITQWIPYGRFTVDKNRIVVLGTNPLSWDSRIWGPIPSTTVFARLAPVLTF